MAVPTWYCPVCKRHYRQSSPRCTKCGTLKPEGEWKNGVRVAEVDPDLIDQADAQAKVVIEGHIHNDATSALERGVRAVSTEGARLLRPACLAIGDEWMELTWANDFGLDECIKIERNAVVRVRVKEAAITPSDQLKRPFVRGALTGVVLDVVVLAATSGNVAISPGQMAAILLLLPPIFGAIMVLLQSPSLVWRTLAVVVFEGREGDILDLAIDNAKVGSFLDVAREHGMVVDSVNSG